MADEDFDLITQPQKTSDQEIQNRSFDREFNIAARLMAAYHVATDTIKRVTATALGFLNVVVREDATLVTTRAVNSSVPDGVFTDLVSFTNSGSEDLFISQILASGQAEAEYQLLIGGTIVANYCTSSQVRSMDVKFQKALKVVSGGTIVKIQVKHLEGTSLEFKGTIFGHRNS